VTEIKEKIEALLRGKKNKDVLLEHEVKQFLKGLGLDIPKGIFVTGPCEASEIRHLKRPLIAKAASRLYPSKTDIGGVRGDLRTRSDINAAIRELMQVKGSEGVLVEEMATGRLETIVGGIIDPQFGPVVMFGLGGFFVEAMRDVVFGLAPLSEKNALELIQRIKGISLLKGIRGKPPADMEAIAHAVSIVSEIIATGLVEEIDINPLMVSSKGAVVLDAKMRLK
jgi:succinyl-CoA synthetase beta subunit